MKETNLKIGSKPWTIEKACHYNGRPLFRVTQRDEEIVEIHIVITEQGETMLPYYKKGDSEELYLYNGPLYATKEEAVEAIREIYRDYIKDLEKATEFFKKALEELK